MTDDRPGIVPAFDLGGYLRRGRRRKDLSQRQLAERAQVSPATVARLEARFGAEGVRLSTLMAVLVILDLRLVCVDDSSGLPLDPHVSETWRDAAGRHLPPHLEPRPTAGPDDEWWWGWLAYSTWMVPPQPEHSYFRNRRTRDMFRRHVDPWRGHDHPQPPATSDTVSHSSSSDAISPSTARSRASRSETRT
jgi:transcriptional regulator with XRE-family HTH domain